MIQIKEPKADVSIVRRSQGVKEGEAPITPVEGFIDLHEIPRDKGGLIFFYNHSGELLFVGKARKLRQRVKKHLQDNTSPLRNHRDEIHRIEVAYVEDAMERDIYETYLINSKRAKYNIDKVYYKQQ